MRGDQRPIDLDHLDELSDGQLSAIAAEITAALTRRLLNGAHSAASESSDGHLLSVEEAASRLCVSPDWVYRESRPPEEGKNGKEGKPGKLHSCVVRIGRTLRIDSTALNKWIIRRRSRQE